MVKHKTEYYKLSAVNYYLKNNVSMDKVCKIFECKKQSLSRWVNRYEKDKSIKRHTRKEISYKITKEPSNWSRSNWSNDGVVEPKIKVPV